MALWKCADCTARYAVGAPECPQCGCRVRVEEGSDDDMAKVTVHGGPSNDAADEQGAGEDVSAGSSSSTSSEKAPPSSEPSETKSPKRARTTGSRSKRAQTESSSAPGTDGDQEAGTSETDSGTE